MIAKLDFTSHFFNWQSSNYKEGLNVTSRFHECQLITDLIVVSIQMLESGQRISGFLDHHVLVQQQLAVLVVISCFLEKIKTDKRIKDKLNGLNCITHVKVPKNKNENNSPLIKKPSLFVSWKGSVILGYVVAFTSNKLLVSFQTLGS